MRDTINFRLFRAQVKREIHSAFMGYLETIEGEVSRNPKSLFKHIRNLKNSPRIPCNSKYGDAALSCLSNINNAFAF